jgi:hypothetical protein
LTTQDKDRATPLHLSSFPLYLVLQEGKVETAYMLIEQGTGITDNKNGETPLRREVAYMIIRHGAEVTAQNKDGKTSLHQASQGGQSKVASMLIICRADVMAQDKNGSAP